MLKVWDGTTTLHFISSRRVTSSGDVSRMKGISWSLTMDDDDDIYLTAIGLTPGGSITRHIYNKQYTQYIENTILEVRAMPRLCELYPDICLTTEGKARKNLS